MNFFGGPNISSLLSLLEKEDTTVDQVLDDPALIAGLKNSSMALINFLLEREENLNHLLDIAFTDYTPQTPIPKKTIRNGVQVLSFSNTSKILNFLSENEIFLKRINDFPHSEFAKNPRCCANFGTIVESHLRFSKEFFQKIPFLKEFLINNMTNMGLRELFVYLCEEQATTFGVDSNFFTEILSKATAETAFYIVTGINQVIQNKKSFISQITNVDFLKILIDIGNSNTYRIITRVEAFMLAEKIIKKMKDDQKDQVNELIQTKSKEVEFDKIDSDTLLGGILRVLPTNNEQILLRILKHYQPTYINNGIIQSFSLMSNEELTAFITKTNLIQQMKESMSQSYPNSHLPQLAKLIFDKQVLADNDDFKEFYNNIIQKRLDKRNQDYGGTRPHVQFSSDDSDSSAGELAPAEDVSGENLFNSDSSDSDDSDDDHDKLFGNHFDNSSSSSSDISSDSDDFRSPFSKPNLGDSSDDDDSSSSDDRPNLPPIPQFNLPPPPLPNGVVPNLPPPPLPNGVVPNLPPPNIPTLGNSLNSDSDDNDNLPPPPPFQLPPFPGTQPIQTLSEDLPQANQSNIPPPPKFNETPPSDKKEEETPEQKQETEK